MIEEKNILEKISKYKKCKDIDKYISGEKILPKYYCCSDRNNIKAIILGCDPTNTKNNYEFQTVFGLEESNKRNKFFESINKNLKSIGLDESNIYVQNLCRNYFFEETGTMFKESNLFSKEKYNEGSLEWKIIVDSEYEKNEWIKVALEWIRLLKFELDELDVERNIPVFITSQYLIPPLINDKYNLYSASYYYRNCKFIDKDENKLERIIIPLFRHCTYILDEQYLENRIINDKYCNNYIKALSNLKCRNTKYKEKVIKIINK